MEVRLSPELRAKLDRVAAQQGRDAESLVHEAAERLVGYDEWFVREVEKSIEQIERGEVLEHEEVGARLEKLWSEKKYHPTRLVNGIQVFDLPPDSPHVTIRCVTRLAGK